MKNKTQAMIYILVIFTAILLVFTAATLTSQDVSGANNISTITRVNVTNTEPNLYDVTIITGTIDLVPGSTKLVNCTGEVYDLNGWDDVVDANATFYMTDDGDGTTFDNNYRYQNTSCSCTQLESEALNASCSCNFNVWYYAKNGTWRCNMTIADSFGLSDTLESGDATINTVIGIDAPAEIDYGDLSVTETSSEIPANITNFGNVPINISIRGYGGTDSDSQNNLSMICSYGNITSDYERYSLVSGTSFASMINITNTTTMLSNFTLPIRTDDISYGNDTNTTYWKLNIPATVSGVCNGTVEFYAIDNS